MLTKNDKRLLRILYYFGRKKIKVDIDKLEEINEKNPEIDVSWEPIIKKLSKQNLILTKENNYCLTEEGRATIYEIIIKGRKTSFSKALITRDKSDVYRKYCERIYGKFLCQMNMTNMEQIAKLISALELSEENEILDVGCGIGRVSEYISDVSHAKITGVDLAKDAILRAQQRTREKSDRIKFVFGNIDELKFNTNEFDRIIAIDTVGFARNLLQLIKDFKRILKPKGKMGIFYSERIEKNEDPILLDKDHTKLANALNELDLPYKTFDLNEDEIKHWNNEFKVTKDLKEEFQQADEIDLYNSRIRETTEHLKYMEDNRTSRHLYIVQGK